MPAPYALFAHRNQIVAARARYAWQERMPMVNKSYEEGDDRGILAVVEDVAPVREKGGDGERSVGSSTFEETEYLWLHAACFPRC